MAENQMRWRATALASTAFLLETIAAGSGSLDRAWEPIARVIGLREPPVAASANVLSEHELEVLDTLSPQHQASLLLPGTPRHHR
jgi:hypothetical protein